MDSQYYYRTFLIADAPWLQPDSFLSRFNSSDISRGYTRMSPVTNTTLRNTKFVNILFTPALFHFN